MNTNNSNKLIKTVTSFSFLIMLIANGLAIFLPINGVTQAQISDSYPNLFAPAGISFSIWGLIYLLLTFYTIYQNVTLRNVKTQLSNNFYGKIGMYFSISSIAIAAWVFSWHYKLIPLSMFLMIIILICLILINNNTNYYKLTIKEKIFIRLPFSVYFGWITVATIANATTLFVSLGWDRFGLSEASWAIFIISIGLIIGVTTMMRNRDIAYGLVIIWAYAGIWIKHTSESGFSGQYPAVITTVTICIVLLIILEAYVIFNKFTKTSYKKENRAS